MAAETTSLNAERRLLLRGAAMLVLLLLSDLLLMNCLGADQALITELFGPLIGSTMHRMHSRITVPLRYLQRC